MSACFCATVNPIFLFLIGLLLSTELVDWSDLRFLVLAGAILTLGCSFRFLTFGGLECCSTRFEHASS